jgi:hypothetical protein
MTNALRFLGDLICFLVVMGVMFGFWIGTP